MGIFNEVYLWLYEWLFNSTQPTYLTQQGTELAVILCTVFVIVLVLGLAIMPIKAIVKLIFRM